MDKQDYRDWLKEEGQIDWATLKGLDQLRYAIEEMAREAEEALPQEGRAVYSHIGRTLVEMQRLIN